MFLKRNKQRNRATQLQQNPVFFGSIAILPSHTQKLILSTTEQTNSILCSYTETIIFHAFKLLSSKLLILR